MRLGDLIDADSGEPGQQVMAAIGDDRPTIAAIMRQATRKNIATTLIAACAVSHAQVSSNAQAWRAPGRAHGT
ncbi:MAG: hypothetical protein PHQ28_12345 [Mycobacterium sp.]|nr:hypothetical protein [Mycobacterium sp.]